MSVLEIHDKKPATNGLGSFLSFDLRDIINQLAPLSLQAVWIVCPVKFFKSDEELFEATDVGGKSLEKLAESDSLISGLELAAIAEKTRQVIWGQFIGHLPNSSEPWVVISAIDSTFYEIISDDETVLSKIRSGFSDIRQSDLRYG